MVETPIPQRCPSCDSDLTGLPTDVCPKCGAAFKQVEHVELSNHHQLTRKAVLWRAAWTGVFIVSPLMMFVVAMYFTVVAAVTPLSGVVVKLGFLGLWAPIVFIHWRQIRPLFRQCDDQSWGFRLIVIATLLLSDFDFVIVFLIYAIALILFYLPGMD